MELLPPTALSNVRVGVSTSNSPDLGRLGLLEGHFRLAIGELARTVLNLGGALQYGGHLDPAGYTTFLLGEVQRFGRAGELLSVVLPWPVHRGLSLRELRRTRLEMDAFATITCLGLQGTPIDHSVGRGDDPIDVPPGEIAPSLSEMRQYAINTSNGRVLIGGRRSGYSGAMPGVLEEALLAVRAGQPVYLAGGFGGAAYDAVRAIYPPAAEWFVPGDDLGDDGWREGIGLITDEVGGRNWESLRNGLSPEENVRLAATHRPSEIVTLVALGLGRVASNRR